MNSPILYPSILIIIGILLSTTILIILFNATKKFVKLFQLYTESKIILNYSLKIVSILTSLVVFLIFLRWAFKIWGLKFTVEIIEKTIIHSPKMIIAIFLILLGFLTSKYLREHFKSHSFEYKFQIEFIFHLIIIMTFILSALIMIEVNIEIFKIFYIIFLSTVGLIIAISIGIPIGFAIKNKLSKKKRKNK